jgi:hypothetical protein
LPGHLEQPGDLVDGPTPDELDESENGSNALLQELN